MTGVRARVGEAGTALVQGLAVLHDQHAAAERVGGDGGVDALVERSGEAPGIEPRDGEVGRTLDEFDAEFQRFRLAGFDRRFEAGEADAAALADQQADRRRPAVLDAHDVESAGVRTQFKQALDRRLAPVAF